MELNTRDVVGIGLFSFVIGFGFGKVIGDKALAAKQKELDDYKRDVNLNRQIEENVNEHSNEIINKTVAMTQYMVVMIIYFKWGVIPYGVNNLWRI